MSSNPVGGKRDRDGSTVYFASQYEGNPTSADSNLRPVRRAAQEALAKMGISSPTDQLLREQHMRKQAHPPEGLPSTDTPAKAESATAKRLRVEPKPASPFHASPLRASTMPDCETPERPARLIETPHGRDLRGNAKSSRMGPEDLKTSSPTDALLGIEPRARRRANRLRHGPPAATPLSSRSTSARERTASTSDAPFLGQEASDSEVQAPAPSPEAPHPVRKSSMEIE